MSNKTSDKRPLDDESSTTKDRAYWLSRTPEERLAEVQRLRRQVYGDKLDDPIQHVARIVKRSSSKVVEIRNIPTQSSTSDATSSSRPTQQEQAGDEEATGPGGSGDA